MNGSNDQHQWGREDLVDSMALDEEKTETEVKSRGFIELDGPVILATGFLEKLRGLLFYKGGALYKGCLVLTGCHDVHTFGMRSPIDVAFADSRLKIQAVYRDLPPGRRVKCKGAALAIERFSRPGLWLEPCDQLLCEKKTAVPFIHDVPFPCLMPEVKTLPLRWKR